MRNVSSFLLLAGITISICGGGARGAWAKASDATTTKNSEPTAADLKKSKPRGIFFQPIGEPVAPMTHVPVPKKTAAPPIQVKSAKPVSTPVKKVVQAPVKFKRAVAGKKPNIVTTSAPTVKKTDPVITIQSSKTAQFKTVSTAPEGAAEGEAPVVKAWLNKAGHGPRYKDGDRLEVNVTANRDCNVTILDFDGSGRLTQIFPNDFQQDTYLKAGKTIKIGGPESSFDFQAAIPKGMDKSAERLFVYAYPRQDSAPISVALLPERGSPFRSAEMTLEKYRDLVNQSKVYFSRGIKVLPKHGAAPNTEAETASAPNKVELIYHIEK